MDIIIHKPERLLKSTIALRGSKSISNRILIIRAISGLNFNIQNLSDSEDTQLLQKALLQIQQGNNRYIDVNHAGSDFRFLTALLSITQGDWTLTGSERMKQRPVGELVTTLNKLGAGISYDEREGFPPLSIKGTALKGGSISIKGDVSSQFITALLLIAPCFENGLELTITTELVSKPYVDMTISIMKQFGIDVSQQANRINVKPGKYVYTQPSYLVEGDWSSASYWYSIAALSEACEITLENLFDKSLQADSIIKDIYSAFGINTQTKGSALVLYKDMSKISKEPFSYNFMNCPDIAQTVACTCLGLGINAYLSGLQTLRIKETDRIQALKNELEKLNAGINVSENSIDIVAQGIDKRTNSSLSIHTYHDHRMAMSFAPLCLTFDTIRIEDAGVVEKSYPNFWKDLEQVGFIIKKLP